MIHGPLAAVGVAVLVGLAPAVPLPTGLPGGTQDLVDAVAHDEYMDVAGRRSERQHAEERRQATPDGREWRWVHSVGCTRRDGSAVPAVDGLCDDGLPLVSVLFCDPSEWRPPRWRTYREAGSTEWSPWESVDQGTCPADRVPALTAEDFRRLPLPAPTLTMQPEGDWVLVNVETIVLTDPEPVVLTTDLLGFPVEVEARPSVFRYDFGDGSEPLVTRDPGRAYPDFTTHHVYLEPGDAAITLTTTWTGRYRLVGTQEWREVAGTAQTSTTGPTFRIEERTSRLVSGLCTDRPRPPDC